MQFIKFIVLKVMIKYKGISQNLAKKLTFWLALTLKPYNI